MKGLRLDIALVDAKLATSREAAKRLIMAGQALVNGQTAHKPSELVGESDELSIKEQLPFVSRGGLKLQKAIEKFGIELDDRVVADIGASTGGFTDCCLQHGAKKVYAIDVGYGQLSYSLRNNPCVVVMERTNARSLLPEMFTEPIEFASIDVSFISARLILPALKPCMAVSGEVVLLVKPQFEAGRESVGKNGVVRDSKVHTEVIQSMVEYCRGQGWGILNLDYSPVKGPQGNIEFLLHLKCAGGGEGALDIAAVVIAAHAELD